MAGYRAGATTSAALTLAPFASLHTNGNLVRLLQWSMSATSAVKCNTSLGIAGNNATPPVATTSVTPQSVIQATIDVACTARLDTAWSTAPTAPTVVQFQTTLPSNLGAGWTERYPDNEREPFGLGQTTAQWLVWWNYGGSTNSAMDMAILLDQS